MEGFLREGRATRSHGSVRLTVARVGAGELLHPHRLQVARHRRHRRDVLRPRAVIAADQPRAFLHPARQRGGEIFGAGGVIEAALVEFRLARVRDKRESRSPSSTASFESRCRQACGPHVPLMPTMSAPAARRIFTASANVSPVASRPSSLTPSEVTTGILRRLAEDLQRQQQFIERGESLQENQIAAALQQRADLLAENRLAVVERKTRHRPGASESGPTEPPTKTSPALDRLPRHLRRAAIDFAHLVLQPKARQPHAVRAEAVGLDHLRAGIGVFLINARRAVPAG